MGVTGEYEDYNEWIVCAYKDIKLAEEHALLATTYALEFFVDEDRYSYRHEGNLENPFDERMQMDYNGTKYFIITIELRESLPKSIKFKKNHN